MKRKPIRIGLVTTLCVSMFAVESALAEIIRIEHGYHRQRTDFYCGIAAIQMMLDTPAVRNNNPAIDAYFTANAGNDQLIQDQIYTASRHRRALFNPFGIHPGTDPVTMSYTINAYDGIPNGPALPGGVAQGANTNGHAYGWYGFAPTVWAGDQASRTVAYALKNFDVPASVVVGGGRHWVVVNGVNTIGEIPTPANPGAQFEILGFSVSDPWVGRGSMGRNAWYGYGYNAAHNGFARPGAWFNFFDPTLQPGHAWSGQFNILVEPRGEEPGAPFDPDSGEYSSQPDPYGILDDPLDAGGAHTRALEALAGDFSFLADEFVGGSWSDENIMLFSYPDDPTGFGDWLVPYIGPGGFDEVLGSVMIDSVSGRVSQAMWFDDGVSFNLEELTEHYTSLYALEIPDTFVPAPGGLVVFVLLGAAGVRRRRPGASG